MKYYRVPKELDGKRVFAHRQQKHISFVGGELFTLRELDRMGIAWVAKKLEAVEVSRKKNILVLWRPLRARGRGEGGYSMKAATGNDAPRGGAEGDYIELTPKGLRQTRELRGELIKENSK